MYGFVDTNTTATTKFEPVDNMSIEGTKINEVVGGYRQLYVDGRQLISRKVDTTDVPLRSGQWFNFVYDEMREITVYFMIEGDSSESLRESFSRLNKILRTDKPGEINFADEKDWSYYGVLGKINCAPEQNLTVRGDFTMICPDPYKYSKLQSSTNGVVTLKYADKVFPTLLEITPSKTTDRIEVKNGEKRLIFEGSYQQGSKITIKYDNLEFFASYQGHNILHEIQLYTPPSEFWVRDKEVITAINASVSRMEWRDKRL